MSTEPNWPAQRSRRSTVAAQFGADRADLMAWALTTADPLADAVVDEIHEQGRTVRVALATGIARPTPCGPGSTAWSRSSTASRSKHPRR
ncbi:hypothetical protein [Amycolatopsis sp. NBC_01480]|uniref:hypothetical protein n=1 Tax=Amycolatopsis sp. NBC_01480 TaxID=2903562 RepID=UPI002E2CCB04|nr:hypothetical protein [Amycolatopsis sp. NBC_01480]